MLQTVPSALVAMPPPPTAMNSAPVQMTAFRPSAAGTEALCQVAPSVLVISWEKMVRTQVRPSVASVSVASGGVEAVKPIGRTVHWTPSALMKCLPLSTPTATY